MTTKLILAATLLIAGSASASLSTPNAKYRSILADGTGNCIFSDGSLPFEQEGSYSVKTDFTAPERPQEVRCYFPQKLNEYQSQGAFFNSLRDESGRYNSYALVADSGGTIQWENVGVLRMNGGSYDWDQQRFIWDPSDSRCTAKDDSAQGSSAGCLDPERRLRAIAKEQGAALPYTGKVCQFVFFNWTDQFEKRWDGRQEIKDPISIQTTNIASGCAEYTVQ